MYRKKALGNINLEIEKGSLVALVGQNGSGKSTLSKIISGILARGSGTAEVAGLNPHSKRDRLKLPLHVSYVFQNPDHQIFTRSAPILLERIYCIWISAPCQNIFLLACRF